MYNNNDVLRSYVTRVYDRPVNLSSEFRNAVEKLSDGRMELMFVPAGATRRYQVNDTTSLAQAVERLCTETGELVVRRSDEDPEPDAQQRDIEYFT